MVAPDAVIATVVCSLRSRCCRCFSCCCRCSSSCCSVGAVSACVSALVVRVFSAGNAAVFDAAFVGVQLFLMLPLLVLLLFVALLYN